MAASEAAPRVALLARAGEACERIDSALREAGAEVVLVADPQQSEPEQVRGAQPQAILVALDPAIEDAIDRYADVLADPGYMVIFEEADQVAQRTGWDAARWLRHLSAKLHRHGDVLPAGGEVEEELHPTPGPLPVRTPALDFEQAIVAVTGEAQQLADEVPRDSGLERPLEQDFAFLAEPPAEALSLETTEAAPADDADAAEADAAASGDGIELTLEDDAIAADDGIELTLEDDADAADDGIELTLEDDTGPLQSGGDADAGIDAGLDFEIAPVDLPAADESHDEALSFDPARFSRADRAGEAGGGIEEFLAAQGALAARDAEREADEADAEAPAGQAADEPAPAAAPPKIDFSGLSLVEDDAPPPPPPATPSVDKPAPAFDLDSLGSGLSLADPDSYGHGPKRGAVLIEAGLGGPDAVRQLLAALPESFPQPILIRLPLEGGRYDRLVRQMTRATQAPVAVAEQGQAVRAGSIYFVPPGFGVRQAPSGWTFDESLALDPATLLAADDSAVLFLSGADAALVAGVTGDSWSGGLVLAQSPDEGCYDPAAASAAIAAGAPQGTPAALASRLLERWPPPGQAPDPDPSGMLSP